MSSSSTNTDPKAQKATVDDDDDLDDLDDVLTKFNVPPKPTPSSASKVADISQPSPSTAPRSVGPTDPALQDLPPELAAELEQGMADLLRQMSVAPIGEEDPLSNDIPLSIPELTEEEKKFRDVWEKMLVDGMNGADTGDASNAEFDELIRKAMSGAIGDSAVNTDTNASGSSATTKQQQKATSDAFQDAIQQAMNKLKTSEESLKPETDPSPDQLAALLSQFGDLPEGGELPPGMEGMLENMLGALMSKEILYEPLKELADQLPGYLSTHTDIPESDKSRYVAQERLSKQIVAIFEKPGYRDEDQTTAAEVLRLMNEMQTYGSPPPEVMGSLPEGLTPEALASGEGCIIS